ncbi:MAG: Mov34/MPN/PAD-1 family protein [Candidatus Contendobacter sp.]
MVYGRGAGHVRYEPLPESHRDALVLHVHSHGDGEAYFSVQDDRANREAGDSVYVAVVFGRCRAVETITEAWRRVIWRWRFDLPGSGGMPAWDRSTQPEHQTA